MSAAGPKSNPDRRFTPRARVEITSMFRAADQKICGIVIDLTENGMAIRSSESLLLNSILDVWFSLPYSDCTIQCEGKVIWTDGLGRAGVQFLQLPEGTKLDLLEWLTQYAPKPGA
jgi:hypothetical protein